ncbi:glucosamine-6-phosphate deaminase [Panacibacter ginsenosidivorans]|uniref:Glucosamine-6-phosphate deaminase n=1 Tax=Panacibacter ginsenosidivorans TaxID=1813871 RepID=A0A5B8V5D9_9BACT|nr:glucosamine-6-phosphate deaminase [Panacibacter ginsenosidivorans]QEC65806.1 glucosamine-6-phosphate deaminase [Panacibacter ginsenosidivorans]
MKINIYNDTHELGKAAGTTAAQLIREAIKQKGSANIILATGTSQFETLNQLITEKEIDWSKVVMFHLDEYIGLPITHPASFRKYLQERFISKVPKLKAAHLINGEANPQEECEKIGNLISKHPIDVALVGIGENGHLAFNDPPADFETEQPYIVVTLDEQCRKQQLGEGWFKSFDEVPTHAISMSVKQILRSKHIICSVPDERKAMAVKNSLEKPINNLYPATILQQHEDCTFYLDKFSSALLSKKTLA